MKKQKNGSPFRYGRRFWCCWYFQKICKLFNCFKKIWLSLRLCVSYNTQIWQKIISETNIFSIFPASEPHNTVSKILQSNYITQTRNYVPVRSLWLNRVFTDLANSREKHGLTIDCSWKRPWKLQVICWQSCWTDSLF